MSSDQTKPTAERKTWDLHRRLLARVPGGEAGHRGCFGLALMINATTANCWQEVAAGGDLPLTFVPDSTVDWATLVDVPGFHFRLGDPNACHVHWASVRSTSARFGMPTLSRGTEVGWRFASLPAGGPHPDLDQPAAPQLFRVFNAIEWAMTTYAFSHRSGWAAGRPALAEALGYPHAKDRPLLVYGNGVYDGAAPPAQWMPRPYLAFPAGLRDDLFNRATRVQGVGKAPLYPVGMKAAFVDAMGENFAYRAPFAGVLQGAERHIFAGEEVVALRLRGDAGQHAQVRFPSATCVLRVRPGRRVAAGEVVAEERLAGKVPQDWYDGDWRALWAEYAPRLVPARRLDLTMRLWFDRQAVDLVKGYVHVPAQLASPAALGSADGDHLFWEVSGCLEYYRDDCDAVVFPAVPIRHWSHLAGRLPGDVAYDLHPADFRYETPEEKAYRMDAYRQQREARDARRHHDQVVA